MRAANGHPEPYHVKFWNIGNEMWGDWQYGYMSLAQYEVKHNLFAKAMRKVDPTIILIARWRHARHHDRFQAIPETERQADSRLPRAGRLDGRHCFSIASTTWT